MLPKLRSALCLFVAVVWADCAPLLGADSLPGHRVYEQACAHCHGNAGEGWREKNGPTLRGTEWVLGDADRLLRVTLGGLYLRIPLGNGTHYGSMGGLKNQFTDQEIADLLTYVRQSWGNNGGAVDPRRVAELRPEALARALPYTALDFGLKGLPKLGPGGEALEPEEPFAAAGFKLYQLVCMSCHQPTGLGVVTEDGHGFPPLSGSEYVTGSPRRLVRIVLGGLQGPVTVRGRVFSEIMPPWHPALDDEQIAQILTFVRQGWLNLAPPISPDLVRQLRPEAQNRKGLPWTLAELETLERSEGTAKARTEPPRSE